MTVSLTGQNPYALSTNSQMQFASKGANSKSTSLSSGIRQDMSVVENGISNKLSYEKGTLTVVNKNMSYQKSQLNVMQNSLNRMKETLAKMNEVVISSYNKSDGQRKDLQNAIETYVELFNKQLSDAEFGDKKLLGGEHFNTDMRVGTNSNDTYNMKLNAMDSMRTDKQAQKLLFSLAAGVVTADNGLRAMLANLGLAHNDGDLGAEIYAVATRTRGAANVQTVITDIVGTVNWLRNGGDPAGAGGGDGIGRFAGGANTKANLLNIIKRGPEAINTLISVAAANKAQRTGGDQRANTEGVALKDGMNAAQMIDLRDDTNAKATEAVIKEMVNLIDGKLVEVHAYIDSVESISDSQQSKIEVTTETLDAYSKTDIVKAAQEFQDFLTKLKLSLQVLSSGQRLSDEAMQSVRSSLNG